MDFLRNSNQAVAEIPDALRSTLQTTEVTWVWGQCLAC